MLSWDILYLIQGERMDILYLENGVICGDMLRYAVVWYGATGIPDATAIAEVREWGASV